MRGSILVSVLETWLDLRDSLDFEKSEAKLKRINDEIARLKIQLAQELDDALMDDREERRMWPDEVPSRVG